MVKEYPLVQICCLYHAEVIKQYTTEQTRLFETWIKKTNIGFNYYFI